MITVATLSLDNRLSSDVESFGAGATLYSSLEWNRAFAGRDATSYVLVARDKHGEILGVLLAHLMLEGSRNTVYDAGSLLGPVSDAKPHQSQLLLGARNGQWNGYRVVATDSQTRRRILSALVEHARRLGGDLLAFLYAPEEAANEVAEVIGSDAAVILTDANSTVHLDDGGFDTYQARMPAKRRSDLRRDLASAGGFPNWEEVRADDPDLPTWASLAAETQRRHEQPADESRLESYLRSCILGGGRAVVFWYGDRQAPTAFSLALLQSDVLWLRLVGLRYDDDGGTSGRYRAYSSLAR